MVSFESAIGAMYAAVGRGELPADTEAEAASLDLDTIRPWLAVCGACDAGLSTACAHPDGDYRTPMAALVTEVRRLRQQETDLRAAVDDARRWAAHLEAENAAALDLLDLEHVTRPCPSELTGPCSLVHQVARALGVTP